MTASAHAPPPSAVLGVDLGTSAVKAVVVSQGRILSTASAPLDVLSSRPGWSEQHPESWLKAATIAVRAALAQSAVVADYIRAIGLSGQMHGAVTLDRHGTPIRPAILWNDNRSTVECADLAKTMPEIGRIAGIGPLPGFTAPKLMWMRTHEQEHFEAIRHIMLPKDYLGYWMTGNAVTDTSDAAGTLWLDQGARVWSAELAHASGIDPDWLPEIKSGFDLAGSLRAEVAEALGLAHAMPVFTGGGDAATGALSLGAAEAGKCFISLGTSGQFLMVDDAYLPAPDKYVHAYCHTLPGKWYRMAAMLNGARPLAWFAQVLKVSVSDMLAQAEACDPARIPLFLPYLTGERSPHGDPDIRGCFYGLDDATGSAEMARAVVEAVAFSMRDARESFGPDFAPESTIPAIGGGSRSDAVLQALADTLQHPVARTDAGEGGAAMGAALLAEVGCGMRSSEELVFAPALTCRFDPQEDAALLERFESYQALYQALRPIHAR